MEKPLTQAEIRMQSNKIALQDFMKIREEVNKLRDEIEETLRMNYPIRSSTIDVRMKWLNYKVTKIMRMLVDISKKS